MSRKRIIKNSILALVLGTSLISYSASNLKEQTNFEIPKVSVFSQQETKDNFSTTLTNKDINNTTDATYVDNDKVSANGGTSSTKITKFTQFKAGTNSEIISLGNIKEKFGLESLEKITFTKDSTFDIYRTMKGYRNKNHYDESDYFWAKKGMKGNEFNNGVNESPKNNYAKWDEVDSTNKGKQIPKVESDIDIYNDGAWVTIASSAGLYAEWNHDGDDSGLFDGSSGSGYQYPFKFEIEGQLLNDIFSLKITTGAPSNGTGDYNHFKAICLPTVSITGQVWAQPLSEFDDEIAGVENENLKEIESKLAAEKAVWTSANTYGELRGYIESVVNTNVDTLYSSGIKYNIYNENNELMDDSASITSPEVWFEIASDGSVDNIPITTETGEANKTKKFEINFPYVESCGIESYSSLPGMNVSESGQLIQTDFDVMNTGEKVEADLLTNTDTEFWFITDGWVKVEKPDNQFDGILEPKYSLDFAVDLENNSNNYYSWETEYFIPQEDIDNEQANIEGIVTEYDETRSGYWADIQTLDEVYETSDSERSFSKELHTQLRWSYLLSPEYFYETDESTVSTIGRLTSEEFHFEAYADNSDEVAGSYENETNLTEYTLKTTFDSTPLFDSEVFAHEELIVSGITENIEEDPGKDLNDYFAEENILEVSGNVKTDIFGNKWTDDGNNVIDDGELSGTGDDPYLDEDNTDPEYAINSDGTWVTNELGMPILVWEAGGEYNTNGHTSSDRKDESNDDIAEGWNVVGGNVTPLERKHFVSEVAEDTSSGRGTEESNKEFIDVFVAEIEEGDTLEEVAGDDSDTTSEEEKRWLFDSGFLIESNPFINKYSLDPKWNEEFIANGFIYKTATINDSYEFKIILTDREISMVESEIKEDLQLENFFLTKDGKELLDNLKEREILSFASSDGETVSEITDVDAKAAIANSELDAASTKLQWELYNEGFNINDTTEHGEITDWIKDKQKEFINSQFEVDHVNKTINYVDEFDLRVGNTLTANQVGYIKENLIDKSFYTVGLDGKIVNSNEWSVKFNGYEKINVDWESGAFDNLDGIQFDEQGRLADYDFFMNYKNAIEEAKFTPSGQITNNLPDDSWTVMGKEIDSETNKGTVVLNDFIMSASFEVTHNPTRGSKWYDTEPLKVYLPIWVSSKASRTIEQYGEQEVNSFIEKVKLEAAVASYSIDYNNLGEVNSEYEYFVDPKKRTTIDPGNKINSNETPTTGNRKDPLTGQWIGSGDNPETEVDESLDDKVINFRLTKKDYIDFLFNQTIWEIVSYENTANGTNRVWKESDSVSIFTDVLYSSYGFTENDIKVEFGINGVRYKDIPSNEKLLKGDKLNLWISPQENNNSSKWIVSGSAEYTFNVFVPEGLELPKTDPDVVEENFSWLELFGWILMLILIIALLVLIIIWIKKRKSAKKLI